MKEFNPQILAFYLPQYYPTPENNEWYGEGFTEWTNVAKAKPAFKGHVQPKIPTDLGFYDLRLPQVRQKQAELAKEAGVTAFCYYDYWFGDGTVALDLPIKEVVRLGEPDFPFCFCWANHSWYKKSWNPTAKKLDQKILREQKYLGVEDYTAHFMSLLPAFKDRRYYRIDGRLVYVVLSIIDMPDFDLFKTTWNNLAKENGLPMFYFLSYSPKLSSVNQKPYTETEGTILSLLTNIQFKQNYSKFSLYKDFIKRKIAEWTGRPLYLHTYEEAMPYLLDPILKEDNAIPVIFPNWDYTPRRGAGGLIFHNATPELFKQHVKEALNLIQKKPLNKQIIFLKSWNEWGEGNYMEPDMEFGKGRIKALKEAIDEFRSENLGK